MPTAEDYIKLNSITFSLAKYKDEDEIRLSIIVGEGQYGSSAFRNFNGQIEIGAISNRILGIKKNIVGKSILISTTVTDTNPDSNHTSVSYKLNADVVGQQTLDYDVLEDEGTLNYRTTINFS